MNLPFNLTAVLKVASLLAAATLLSGQSSLTDSLKEGVRPHGVGLFSKGFDSKKSIILDRCFDIPRPSDCDVKK